MKKIILSYIFFLTVVSAQVDTTIVYLGSVDSTIVMDVKYATTNNFVGKVLYPTDKVYMRKIVAEKLSEANNYLKQNHNLSIKIFDGYRPLSVQKLMWEILPDPRYVADPSKGSRHNRGAAVDITLIDERGNELEMGTPYDDFTEKAHYDYEDLSDEVKANRKLLRDVMIKFGFEPLETEWWHFDFKGWEKFSILDYEIN
jgi:D-alanyl-D-alanine dipeptidase